MWSGCPTLNKVLSFQNNALRLTSQFRDLEDYAVVYFGSAIFKIIRLLLVAIFSVHFCACIFFRVKEISAEHSNDVVDFYANRNVAEDVGFSYSYH